MIKFWQNGPDKPRMKSHGQYLILNKDEKSVCRNSAEATSAIG